jgi:GT2 family glycosyltransferase
MLYRELAPEPLHFHGVLLGPDAALVALPETVGRRLGEGGLTAAALAELGLPGLAPPFGSVAVSGRAGVQAFAALRPPRHDAAAVLAVDAARDPFDLCEGLDAESRLRLLDFLLGFCRTAFRLGAEPRFAALLRRLARLCAPDAGAVIAIAALPPNRVLLRGGDWSKPVFRIGAASARVIPPEPEAEGLRVLQGIADGDLLVATGESPRRWTVAGLGRALPHVLAAIEEAAAPRAAIRAACARALLAAGGEADIALLHDMQVLAPAEARSHRDLARPLQGALDLAIADGEGGVFLRGWLNDPLDLVAGVSVATEAGRCDLPPDALHRVPRPDLARLVAGAAHRGERGAEGFVAFCTAPFLAHALQPVLSLHLRAGAMVDLVPAARTWPAAEARDAVLASLNAPAPDDAAFASAIIPAAASLHRAAMQAPRPLQVQQFGAPPPRPRVSVLVPLYRTLRFLRFQVAAFATDPDLADVELIYALDSPEQVAEVAHLLRGLHLMHGLPITLLVLPRNCGFAAATNEAAQAAHAPTLLLLNSDVVPAAPGWLAALEDALEATGAAAVGPKLLFDDGSLQHAGLFFERWHDGLWLNRHYHKGLPQSWPAAAHRREVPGVTGAALLVARHDYEDAGGLCEDYVIGDYEDSDFCLRLREGRGEAGGAIVYVPEAELFHFERRSIAVHRGYGQTSAALYNRLLHHARWDAAIEALMARHDGAVPA